MLCLAEYRLLPQSWRATTRSPDTPRLGQCSGMSLELRCGLNGTSTCASLWACLQSSPEPAARVSRRWPICCRTASRGSAFTTSTRTPVRGRLSGDGGARAQSAGSDTPSNCNRMAATLLLLGGVTGEVLASASATEVAGLAFALLDCTDAKRARRLRQRGSLDPHEIWNNIVWGLAALPCSRSGLVRRPIARRQRRPCVVALGGLANGRPTLANRVRRHH